jgi:hypothetical protein
MATQRTVEHAVIQRWVAERDGQPAAVIVPGAEPELRIDFGEAEDNLHQLSWDEFFRIFDATDRAFVYEDESADGEQSLFNTFVHRKADQGDDPQPEPETDVPEAEGDEESDDDTEESEDEVL